MSWRSIKVIGTPNRQAIEACIASPVATVELELEEDALPPHSWELYGMWFVTLRLTGVETPDTPRTPPSADFGDTGLETRFIGVIAGTDIPVRVTFIGDVLYGFEVDL
jgi:hypothetical protein